MKYTGWIAATLLAIVLSILLLTDCGGNNNQELIDFVNRQKDTVIQREKESNAKVELWKDSARKADSLRLEAEVKKDIAEQALNTTSAKVSQLIKQIGQAKVKRDTVEILKNCDSLAALESERTAQIEKFKSQVDSTEKYYKSEISLKDSIINDREQLYSTLRTSYNELSDSYKKTLQTVPKNKRWGIGPNAGITLGADGKVRPAIGVSVQYNIIKF